MNAYISGLESAVDPNQLGIMGTLIAAVCMAMMLVISMTVPLLIGRSARRRLAQRSAPRTAQLGGAAYGILLGIPAVGAVFSGTLVVSAVLHRMMPVPMSGIMTTALILVGLVLIVRWWEDAIERPVSVEPPI